MNRSRLLLIGVIALGLGGFVSLLVYRNLQSRATADNRPGTDVVMAADDLPVGSKLEDKDIKVVRFPAADLPPHYYTQKSQVLGRGVVLPISQGEFVLPGKLAGANAGYGMPSLIPLTVYTAIVPIAGALVALFSIEQLINGWKHGFEGPEDRDDTREAII